LRKIWPKQIWQFLYTLLYCARERISPFKKLYHILARFRISPYCILSTIIMTLRTRKQVQTKMPVAIIIYNEVFINLASSAYIQRNNESRYLSYRPSPKYRRSTRTLWYDILFIIFILKSCTDSNNLNRLKTTITIQNFSVLLWVLRQWYELILHLRFE
jgi:hypothetical protein